MKKLKIVKASAGIILALASLQGVSGTYAEAVLDTITISGSTVVPAKLSEGNGVIIRGTLKSESSAITGVNAGVFDMDGYRITGKTVYPNTKTYDLGQLDNCILFDGLEPGTYYYKVFASNSSTSGTPIVEQKFTVTVSSSSDIIYSSEPAVITNGTTVPESIKEGQGVTIKGTVESEFRIAALTAGIFDNNDHAVYGKRVYPGTKKYDLSQLDSSLTFKQLEPGEYYYLVLAADEKGNEYVLTEQPFTVKADASAEKPADQNVTISGGTKVPLTLTEGYAVIVRGTVKSDVKLNAVTSGIFNGAGKRVTGKTAYPYDYSYDLNKLDDYVLFSDLEPGSYTYQVIASTDDNDNMVLTKQSFTVKAKAASSADTSKEAESATSDGVTISGGTSVPASIKQGNGIIVKGKLSSDNKITAVTVGVYDKNSKRVTGKTVYPSAYTYDLGKLDEYILFSDLEAGTYSYQVIAADAYNKNQVLSKQNFTVKAAAEKKTSENNNAASAAYTVRGKSVTLTNGTNVPAKIKVGEGVDIKGTLTSSSKMTTVTVAVFDLDGKRVTGKTVYPSAYSYDLSKVDSYVNFNKLDAGLYTFEIIAANADSENNILVNKTFRVVK